MTATLFTTTCLEEAEGCDRVAILDAGRVVALGAQPRESGGAPGIARHDHGALRADVERLARRAGHRVDGTVRVRPAPGDACRTFPGVSRPDRALTLGRPTLFDVFVRRTGQRSIEAAGKPGNARGPAIGGVSPFPGASPPRPARVIGSGASGRGSSAPAAVLFWAFFGARLRASFHPPGGGPDARLLFPGTVVLILLFTAIARPSR